MKERPILFSAPMVRALLAGTKTQTRRVVKPTPPTGAHLHNITCQSGYRYAADPALILPAFDPNQGRVRWDCPHGQPGDLLWVRESFCPIYPQDPHYNGGRPIEYDYLATYKHGDRLGDLIGVKKKWKPSIHMPRAASRITLEVTGVRVERLQDISEADAVAEGARPTLAPLDTVRLGAAGTAKEGFRQIWESINGPDSWEANPWVWVVEFKRAEGEKT